MAAFLADASLRSVGLAAAAWAVIRLFGIRSAAGRHAIWTLTTAGMLLIAVLGPLLPPLPLRVLRPAPAETIPVTTAAPAAAAMEPVQPAAPPAIRQPPPARRITWRQAAAAVYSAGVLIFGVVLAYSYGFTRRLVRASRKVEGGVFESSWISVPMTVGMMRPKILLPAEWREWPADKLDAVMFHERTHVRRADWAVAVLTGVNRCLFWFHPLAWWLERRLAALAEQACDDAALLALGRRECYAQTLLEMAAAVKSGRGRRVWEAMAMARTAEVRRRIERILDETREIPRAWTRSRWIAAAVCSLPLIYLAVAVRVAPAQAVWPAPQTAAQPPQAPAPQPALRPNPAPVVLAAAAPLPVALLPVALLPEAPPVPALPAPAPAAPQTANAPSILFTSSTLASAQPPYPYLMEIPNMDANLLQKVDPVYPPEALQTGIQGDVRLRTVIGNDGHVKSTRSISGNPLLVPAAQAAVQQYVYPAWPPAGRNFETLTTVTVSFRLPGSDTATPASAPVARWSLAVPAANSFRPPVPVYRPMADYPPELRAANVQGSVLLSITIGPDGHTYNVQLAKSLTPVLDDQAVKAVSAWRFRPASEDGQAVDCAATVRINFVLE